MLLNVFSKLDGWLSFDVRWFLLFAIVQNPTDSDTFHIRQNLNKLTTIFVEKGVRLFVD